MYYLISTTVALICKCKTKCQRSFSQGDWEKVGTAQINGMYWSTAGVELYISHNCNIQGRLYQKNVLNKSTAERMITQADYSFDPSQFQLFRTKFQV